MDKISLLNTKPFETAIEGLQHKIAHFFFGHIHRPILGSFKGIPYSTLRGTNHQVALVLQDPSLRIVGKNEGPQYGVLTRSSSLPHNRLTWLLETPLMPMDFTSSSTERMEMPYT